MTNNIDKKYSSLTLFKVKNLLKKFYNENLKSKFAFNRDEIKRTQFCLDLADYIIGDDKNNTIADIGPGRRLFTGMMAQKNHKHVTAIDMAYYKGCEIKSDNFTFINSTIQDISDRYDYTFCFEVLEHNKIDDLEKNINKIKSITKKKAVISLPYYEDPVSTKGHYFTLDTSIIKKYFENSVIYLLYREKGFSYIFFVFECSLKKQEKESSTN